MTYMYIYHIKTIYHIAKFSKRLLMHQIWPNSLDKCTRLQALFFKGGTLWLSYPVSHMAPPTPSAVISVSVCGRSRQCFRSYPRNYTSVWLSAPTPGPQDVGTRYQTLIACRVHLSSI